MPEKRFKIAFSYAGEKRDYVAKTADILAGIFGKDKILYDKYLEEEFARHDLSIYLPELYNKDSELVVVVLCNNYNEKEWTGLEWFAIHDLLKIKRIETVLLSRFDLAEMKGLYSGAGFIELDNKTPEEFANLIVQRYMRNVSNPGPVLPITPAYITPKTTIRHNLPPLLPFFGREEELKAIAEVLETDNRAWGILIDADGGMGKTSLAVRAAFDARPDVFDRIIFVTLKTRELDDAGERELGSFVITGLQELLNELATELDRADIAQAALELRPRLLIDALKGTHTLLVLDNLESLTKTEWDTLFTMVKRLPLGCKAILTSRVRVVGSGTEELKLKQLDKIAALDILAEIATHSEDMATATEAERVQLYKATGGKPLLLRWTAGQIGRQHCLTVADAIHYLHSCPEGNDPLEFIFGDLVKQFTDKELTTLCALSYFTMPAKPEHIAPIVRYESKEIEQTLRILVNRSLVLPGNDREDYSLVPLVAEYLRNHKPTVFTETGSQLEQYVYDLVKENGYEKYDQFPVLDAAWPVIAAALLGFLNGESKKLQKLCNAFQHFLNFSGRWDEQLALNIKAEQCAIESNDYYSAGWRAYSAGRIYYLRGQSTEVISCADYAAKYWKQTGTGDREKAVALRLRGNGHEITENYPLTIEAYREAVELDRNRAPRSRDTAIGLNYLAGAEYLSGDNDTAERDWIEALTIAKSEGYIEGSATYTGNLADLALHRKDWLKAENLALEALTLSEKLGRKELIASNSVRVAKALARQGKKHLGLPYARLAVDIYTRLTSSKLAWAQEALRDCEGE